MMPLAVVEAQLAALQCGPAGVEACWAYISPKNGNREGEQAALRFESVLTNNLFYEPFLGCSSWKVEETEQLSDEVFSARVLVTQAPVAAGCVGIEFAPTVHYKFTLSVQEQSPWAGCWMTDAIAPQRPPIDVDARDDDPRVIVGSG